MKKNDIPISKHHAQIANLNRVIGQLEGIKNMIEESRYCIDILQQIKAAKSAIRTIENNILNKHIEGCITSAAASGNQEEIDKKLEELKNVLKNHN